MKNGKVHPSTPPLAWEEKMVEFEGVKEVKEVNMEESEFLFSQNFFHSTAVNWYNTEVEYCTFQVLVDFVSSHDKVMVIWPDRVLWEFSSFYEICKRDADFKILIFLGECQSLVIILCTSARTCVFLIVVDFIKFKSFGRFVWTGIRLCLELLINEKSNIANAWEPIDLLLLGCSL